LNLVGSHIQSASEKGVADVTPPLSLLLPVHNVQATLVPDVAKLLDTLPELTAWFDLLIIDDGSTDATCEIAEELVTEFPQVRLLRHAVRRGVEGSWRIGLGRTDAAIVLGHNGRPGLEPAAIFPLLLKQQGREARGEGRGDKDQGAGARGQGSGDEDTAPAVLDGGRSSSRLVQWLSARSLGGTPPSSGGFCLLRREADLPAVRHPSRWRIEPRHISHTASQSAAPKPAPVPRPVHITTISPARPSFLARLQNLALGE
jgi:glycosyltransferase involved in cell wall biosynthesis